MRPTIYATLLAAAAIAAGTPALAQDSPSGTASFTGETVAIGVGFTWGKGVLRFQGKTYPFKVDGLSAVGAGVTKLSGSGMVYHLQAPADFAGTYAAAGAGGAMGSHGEGGASLKNDKGVVIEFHTREKGISVNLDISGVHIKMAPE